MASKKIILSILALSMLAVVTTAGTWAYFSSTQTGSASISTGKISLVPGGMMVTTPMNLPNIVPGNSLPVTPIGTLTNVGNVPGYLYMTVTRSGNFPADSNNLHVTAVINGVTVDVTNGATNQYLGKLDPNTPVSVSAGYVYDDVADQNTEMDKNIQYDVTLKLKTTQTLI